MTDPKNDRWPQGCMRFDWDVAGESMHRWRSKSGERMSEFLARIVRDRERKGSGIAGPLMEELKRMEGK